LKDQKKLLSKLEIIKNSPNGGRILVNKPRGLSSFQVVKIIKKLIGFKENKLKVGHAGTLDPLAEGLLVICLGKQTKQIFQIQEQNKVYVANFCLGAITDSFDSEFPPKNHKETGFITQRLIEEKIKEKFSGLIRQKPPSFSAVRVQKKRAYQLARQGKKILLPEREVEIYSFRILEFHSPQEILSEIVCSKGTYIRSLVHDLGQSLETGAYLRSLVRTKIGEYNLEEAFSLV